MVVVPSREGFYVYMTVQGKMVASVVQKRPVACCIGCKE